MGNKTAIIIEPCKIGSSEHHHLLSTRQTYDYVRKDWCERNESWCEVKGLEQYFENLKEQYKSATGQSPNLKERVLTNKKTGKKKIVQGWTPIREGVVVISERTTMDDCKRLADSLRLNFGIKTIQIHIDRDEGHYGDKHKWKPNLHAHFVFDWTDGNGKTIKLNEKQMSIMQDVCAYSLGMERGEKEGKKHHLDAMTFKLKAMEETEKEKIQQVARLDNVIEENKKLHEENDKLRKENECLQEQAECQRYEVKVAEEKRDFIYEERDKALVEHNEILKGIATLKTQKESLEKENNTLSLASKALFQSADKEINDKTTEIKRLETEIDSLALRKATMVQYVNENDKQGHLLTIDAMSDAFAPFVLQTCEWAKRLKDTFIEVSNRTLAILASGRTVVESGTFRHQEEEIELKNVEMQIIKNDVATKDYGSEGGYSHLTDFVKKKIDATKEKQAQSQKIAPLKKAWGNWGKKRGMGI